MVDIRQATVQADQCPALPPSWNVLLPDSLVAANSFFQDMVPAMPLPGGALPRPSWISSASHCSLHLSILHFVFVSHPCKTKQNKNYKSQNIHVKWPGSCLRCCAPRFQNSIWLARGSVNFDQKEEWKEQRKGETGKEGTNSNMCYFCFYHGEFEVSEEAESCHSVLVNPDAFMAG